MMIFSQTKKTVYDEDYPDVEIIRKDDVKRHTSSLKKSARWLQTNQT